MIVIPENRAAHIERTAEKMLSENPERWAGQTLDELLDQQEFYLETLSQFDDILIDALPEKPAELFFNVCVHLAIYRTLLQAKRVGWGPLRLIPITIDNPTQSL